MRCWLGGERENGGFNGSDAASTKINVSKVIAFEYDVIALFHCLISSKTWKEVDGNKRNMKPTRNAKSFTWYLALNRI